MGRKVNIRQIIREKKVKSLQQLIVKYCFEESFFLKTDKKGNNLVHEAAQCGSYAILNILLDYFTHKKYQVPNCVNHDGKTPYDLARDSGNEESMESLKKVSISKEIPIVKSAIESAREYRNDRISRLHTEELAPPKRPLALRAPRYSYLREVGAQSAKKGDYVAPDCS